jgi:aldehyde dehydrogenase (NAD+)
MVDTLTIGSPLDNCDISPVISAGQLQRIDGMVQKALAEGAAAFRGGGIATDLPGHFFRPTLLTGVTPDMTIMQEEVFGPVLCICPFDDEAEAVRIANGTSYGLAAGIFTKHLDRAHRVAARLQAGQVYVNKWFAGGIETPFGGVKQSGFGREKGIEGVQNYYRTKNVGCVIV